MVCFSYYSTMMAQWFILGLYVDDILMDRISDGIVIRFVEQDSVYFVLKSNLGLMTEYVR